MNRRAFTGTFVGMAAAVKSVGGASSGKFTLVTVPQAEEVLSQGLVLDAIAAEWLPQSLTVMEGDAGPHSDSNATIRVINAATPGWWNRTEFDWFELRVYDIGESAWIGDLETAMAKVRPALIGRDQSGQLICLIPFETLADRELAWNEFNSDPEWDRLRTQLGSIRIETSLYRRRSN